MHKTILVLFLVSQLISCVNTITPEPTITDLGKHKLNLSGEVVGTCYEGRQIIVSEPGLIRIIAKDVKSESIIESARMPFEGTLIDYNVDEIEDYKLVWLLVKQKNGNNLLCYKLDAIEGSKKPCKKVYQVPCEADRLSFFLDLNRPYLKPVIVCQSNDLRNIWYFDTEGTMVLRYQSKPILFGKTGTGYDGILTYTVTSFESDPTKPFDSYQPFTNKPGRSTVFSADPITCEIDRYGNVSSRTQNLVFLNSEDISNVRVLKNMSVLSMLDSGILNCSEGLFYNNHYSRAINGSSTLEPIEICGSGEKIEVIGEIGAIFDKIYGVLYAIYRKDVVQLKATIIDKNSTEVVNFDLGSMANLSKPCHVIDDLLFSAQSVYKLDFTQTNNYIKKAFENATWFHK